MLEFPESACSNYSMYVQPMQCAQQDKHSKFITDENTVCSYSKGIA